MKCLICKNQLPKQQFTRRHDGIVFFKCLKCDFLQAKNYIKISYERDYFDKNKTGYVGYQHYSKTPIFELFWQIALVKLLGGKSHDRILDVGCATGRFLELAIKEDFEVFGIEISKFASKICKAKGLPIKNEDVEKISNLGNNLDFICAWDLIEHLKKPYSFFEKAIAALSQKGVFVFSTPDASGKNPDWYGFKVSQEHFIYFSKKTIEIMLSQIDRRLDYDLFNFEHDGLNTMIGIVYKSPSVFIKKKHIIYALKNKQFINNKKYDFLLASIYANFNQKKLVRKYFSLYKEKNSLIKLSLDLKSSNFNLNKYLTLLEKSSKYWVYDSYFWHYLIYLKEIEYNRLKEKYEKELYKQKKILEAIYHSKTWQILSYYKKLVNLYKKVCNFFIYSKELYIKDTNIPLLQKLTHILSITKPFYFSHKNTRRLYDIIILSVISWEHKKQRPQHLAREFAKNGHRVFYIENSFVKAKSRNLSKKKISSLLEFTNVEKNIFKVKLVTFNDLFIYQDTISDIVDLNYLLWSIKEVINRAEIKNFIIKVDAPFWYQLTKLLQAPIIYDCLDEHSGFWTHTENISFFERELAKSSRLVIATSNILFKKMKKINLNTILIPNACDFKHFNTKPSLIPKKLENLKRPIIGYFGAISDWLDYKLIKYVATKKPKSSLVVIGNYDSRANIHLLTKTRNIHYLGEVKYEDLPSWIHNFDVCILPFKIIPLTLATNPVKMYETLAAGKPLVSVNLPEVRKLKKLLYIAKTKTQFIQKINLALKEKNTEVINKRMKFAEKNTWDHRYQLIEQSIKKYIYPKVSVVMLSFNTLEYTKASLESIINHSNYYNMELIVVDNGSTDGSQYFLQKAKKTNSFLKLILNKKNLGFAGGNNIGIKAATGEYIILINNDTIVTDNWIEKLIIHLNDKKVGLVGPVTNNIGNEARIELHYKTIEEMHQKAKIYTANHHGQTFEIDNLAFFCVAGRRRLFEEIGPLDEQFKIGSFEDDDYCLRVKKKGYKLLCAEDVFIHHVGRATTSRMPEFHKNFSLNKLKFEKKWGLKWIPHRYRI